MQLITDFHIHSRFSRACSKYLTLPNIEAWCQVKGIDIVGTGDFTHPVWLNEIRQQLEPSNGNTSGVVGQSRGFSEVKKGRTDIGIYQLREKYHIQLPYPVKNPRPVRFLITSEIATIWSQGGRVRRMHTVLVAPSMEFAIKFTETLKGRVKLEADGRPIIGMSARELAERAWEIDENVLVIPAHAWTPWFSVFGSKSGFDSLEECYGDLVDRIYAIETGLSSDPKMNWQWSALDRVALISCSDAHSLDNLGREATVFEMENSDQLSFDLIAQMIREGSPKARIKQQKSSKNYLHSTIEFFPEEGKYHYDGHRACGLSWHPKTTAKNQGKCAHCGRPVTVGVLSRVEELADRPYGFIPKNAPQHLCIVSIRDILSAMLGKGKYTKTIDRVYNQLVTKLGSEFEILLKVPIKKIVRVNENFAMIVQAMRLGNVKMEPGYDGVYGQLLLPQNLLASPQKSLFQT